VTAGPSGWLVFVSHSGEDTWVARQIAREIAACGAATFLDEADIDVGDDFDEDVVSALERADELVVLLTPWAVESLYVWAEIGAVWGRRKRIVGLLQGVTLDDLLSRPGVPMILKRRDLVPLNEIDVYLRQLRGRVQADARTDPEKAP
jgi:hypothetical protein